MKKVIIGLIITTIIAVTLSLSVTLNAESGNITYNFNSVTGELVISGIGEMSDYSDIDETPWKDYYKKIKSVYINQGVTKIGSSAFTECINLTSVTIPSSVKYIGLSAFCNCVSLTSVTIPSSVTVIDEHAFADCVKLTSVTIPSSVKVIDFCAFLNCKNLKAVFYLSDELTTIDVRIFENTHEDFTIYHTGRIPEALKVHTNISVSELDVNGDKTVDITDLVKMVKSVKDYKLIYMYILYRV